jgi:hypothetical protein
MDHHGAVLWQRRNTANSIRIRLVYGLPCFHDDGNALADEQNREFDMRFGKFIMAASAATMAIAPAMAAPVNPAASLSVSKSVRAGSASAKKNELAGGGIIVALIAAAAVIAGIVIVADSDDDADSN